MADDFIGLRVEPSRKESWQEAVEESPEYRDLSHLITLAVESELREERRSGGESNGGADLSGIHDRFDSLQYQLDVLEGTVDDIYQMMYEEADNYPELSGIVQETIPTGDREEILSRDPEKYDDPEEAARHTGSASHIVDYIVANFENDYSNSEIIHAIEMLTNDVSVVEATWADPQKQSDKRVYRVEE